MEMETQTRHTHHWREVPNSLESGDGGYVNCECGEEAWLTEHELTEFRRERTLGIEPLLDAEGLVPLKRM